MTLYSYVSVVDVEADGDDTGIELRPGKVDRQGSALAIPTPENDREEFGRIEWERVDYFPLPRDMTGDEFKEWWNDVVHDDDRPALIDDVLAYFNDEDADEIEEVGA